MSPPPIARTTPYLSCSSNYGYRREADAIHVPGHRQNELCFDQTDDGSRRDSSGQTTNDGTPRRMPLGVLGARLSCPEAFRQPSCRRLSRPILDGSIDGGGRGETLETVCVPPGPPPGPGFLGTHGSGLSTSVPRTVLLGIWSPATLGPCAPQWPPSGPQGSPRSRYSYSSTPSPSPSPNLLLVPSTSFSSLPSSASCSCPSLLTTLS